MSKVNLVNDGDFANQVEQSQGAVIVDFTASWCPPCKMLAPVFEGVAQKYEGKAQFFKCDIDENQDAPGRYGVQKIPNVMFFKDGQVVNQHVGYLNETALAEKVDEILV